MTTEDGGHDQEGACCGAECSDEQVRDNIRRMARLSLATLMRPPWRLFKKLAWLLSGEWMLDCHSNGGAVILARSLFAATWIFASASSLQCLISTTACHRHLLGIHLIGDSVQWFGAIFAALYASLYTRFASQWSYLSDVYNRIKETESSTQLDPRDERRLRIAEWKAAFLEDADELHLAEKPIFAGIICAWLSDKRVQEAYVAHAPKGTRGLRALQERARRAIERSAKR